MNNYPILSRGYQHTIDNTPIQDGKVRFAIDTGRVFLDVNSSRIEFTDFVKGLDYNEIINLKDPLRKIYLSKDTHEILEYDFSKEEWITYGARSINNIDLSCDESGNLILINGIKKVISLEYYQNKITSLEDRVSKLESILKQYTDNIDIIDDES